MLTENIFVHQYLQSATILFQSWGVYGFLYRWFSRYVIAAMLVDGTQKIAH